MSYCMMVYSKLNLRHELLIHLSLPYFLRVFAFSSGARVNGKHLMDSQFSTSNNQAQFKMVKNIFKPLTHTCQCDAT